MDKTVPLIVPQVNMDDAYDNFNIIEALEIEFLDDRMIAVDLQKNLQMKSVCLIHHE